MRYFILLPVSIAFNLLAILLAPVLPLFALNAHGWINNREREDYEPRLPGWLSWFGTPDNSLLGDDGHKERWAGKSRYMQMVAWLWRNPAYTFEWSVLAVEPKGEMSKIGNPWIKNRDNAVAGWYFCRVGDYWNFKVIKHDFLGRLAYFAFWFSLVAILLLPFTNWPLLPVALVIAVVFAWLAPKDTALMTEFGWRLQPWAQERGTGKAQYVFSIRLTAFYPKV